jgi:hypothetical protein
MKEIIALLDSAKRQNNDNNLTIESVKTWLTVYLKMRREETTRFPEEEKLSYWDLAIADYDRSSDAMFILGFFSGISVTFVAGWGDISGLRNFGENNFPNVPDRVIDAFSSRFKVMGKVVVDLDDLLHWLNT